LARYELGTKYGVHSDTAIMTVPGVSGTLRSDLSCTLPRYAAQNIMLARCSVSVVANEIYTAATRIDNGQSVKLQTHRTSPAERDN
jgi:hypothetical protein